jgi:hypothetical protein
MIENTSKRDREIHFAGMWGGQDRYISEMESAGQRELVHSDRLPAEAGPSDADFEAVGFTFGAVDPGDDLFRPATLPEGWKREGSDHAMWSYILDQHGRRRVEVFYKAAFYDRKAFMRLNTVSGYAYVYLHGEAQAPVFDDWCTREAFVEALQEIRQEQVKRVEMYESKLDDPRVSWAAEELENTRAYLAKTDAVIEAVSR